MAEANYVCVHPGVYVTGSVTQLSYWYSGWDVYHSIEEMKVVSFLG